MYQSLKTTIIIFVMNKRTFILLFTFIIGTHLFSQITDFNPQIGISAKASTNGFGADIYYRPMEKLAIKAGAEYLSLNITNKTLESYVGESVNITIPIPRANNLEFNSVGKLKTGALSLAVGYQPFKLLYFTVGIGKYLFASEVIGTPLSDLTFASHEIPDVGTFTPGIAKDDLGIFNVTIKPSNSFIPYLGIGLGNYVPRNKKVSFALELGAYYVGSFKVKANIPQGFSMENIDHVSSLTQEQKDRINIEIKSVSTNLSTKIEEMVSEINKEIEPYKFHPVLKLTIGFKAFDFKK